MRPSSIWEQCAFREQLALISSTVSSTMWTSWSYFGSFKFLLALLISDAQLNAELFLALRWFLQIPCVWLILMGQQIEYFILVGILFWRKLVAAGLEMRVYIWRYDMMLVRVIVSLGVNGISAGGQISYPLGCLWGPDAQILVWHRANHSRSKEVHLIWRLWKKP